jgi:predicted YcjX-like family ATPase
MTNTFYVKIRDNRDGPFDATKLKQLAGDGKISQDDFVSRDGETNWVKASKVHGLFPPESPRPPATPPTPDQADKRGIGETVLDALVPTGFLTRRRRIAITGLAHTGKTVFLTTLISHLKYHDPSTFCAFKDKNDVAVKGFAEVELNDGIGEFDYASHAKAMKTGRWPRKTVDVSACACRFSADRDWLLDYKVEFLDWPGERVADGVMYSRDYAKWSDHLLNFWEVGESNFGRKYLAATQSKSLSEKTTLAEYRLALGHLVLGYNPLISPSCFALDVDGNKLPRGKSAEELAVIGKAGLRDDSQFAPLPKAARERYPNLTAIFSQRYTEYRDQIVCRLFDRVQRCNRLVVLVDIPTILAAGPGMLNDNVDVIEEMLKGLQMNAGKAKTILKRVFNAIAPADWMWTGIEKIAFVATKVDLVAGQENRNNLLALLRQMVWDIVKGIEGVEIQFFVASPVCSTQAPPDGSFLKGKPLFDEQGNRRPPDAPEMTFTSSPVPDKWPENWSSGQFGFPAVYPSIPQGKFQLPKHIGLDDIFRFVLE